MFILINYKVKLSINSMLINTNKTFKFNLNVNNTVLIIHYMVINKNIFNRQLKLVIIKRN